VVTAEASNGIDNARPGEEATAVMSDLSPKPLPFFNIVIFQDEHIS
jgi:hypothetical protein